MRSAYKAFSTAPDTSKHWRTETGNHLPGVGGLAFKTLGSGKSKVSHLRSFGQSRAIRRNCEVPRAKVKGEIGHGPIYFIFY